MDTFIGEDEFAIFEGWLRDISTVDPSQFRVEKLARHGSRCFMITRERRHCGPRMTNGAIGRQ